MHSERFHVIRSADIKLSAHGPYMRTKKYRSFSPIVSDYSSSPVGVPQRVSASGEVMLLVAGGFYPLEDWQGKTTAWFESKGEIVFDCRISEALVKLTGRIIPVQRGSYSPLKLLLKQGETVLFEDVVSQEEPLSVYVSIIEGQNKLTVETQGEVLSPFETCGDSDSRRLSFAFQDLTLSIMS